MCHDHLAGRIRSGVMTLDPFLGSALSEKSLSVCLNSRLKLTVFLEAIPTSMPALIPAMVMRLNTPSDSVKRPVPEERGLADDGFLRLYLLSQPATRTSVLLP